MIRTDLNTDTQKSADSIRSIFEKSFPFFFIMDAGLKILKTGRSLKKLIAIDSNFIDVIGFYRPNIINIKNEFNDILKITDQLCILSLKKSEHNLKLKGTFRLLEEDKMIFLGSPWITKESDLDLHGFTVDDFDVSDGVIDMIMLNKINETYIEDLKTMNKNVTESNILIAKQKAELEKFFNLSLDFMCIANTDGYFIKVNNTFIQQLGYEESELFERQFLEFIHPDDIDETISQIKRLRTGEAAFNFENRYRKKDGEYLVLNWNSMPDPLTGLLYATARDMTLFYKEKNVEIENIRLKSQELTSSRLIKKVLPESLAERMLNGENFISDYYPQTSIMFADICNFSQIIMEMPANTVLNLMEIIFSRFDKIINKYGCEKIKTIGDGYLAIAGAPVFRENHAEQILKAALEILEPIDFPEEVKEYFPETIKFNVRVGIHIGPVVGCVLPGDRMHWDIFSEAVNIASRMESNCLPGKIHVSSDFVKHLKNRIALNKVDLKLNFERRGEIEIKNIGRIHTYFIDKAVSHE